MYIRFESDPSYQSQNFLFNGLVNQAKQHGFLPHERFAFLLYDDNHKLYGGIKGSSFYGSLYIDYVYIDCAMRGQGYGKALLTQAETWGKEHDCQFSTLTTMSFEAKDFYIKCGYAIEFEQSGYAQNARMFYFRKEL